MSPNVTCTRSHMPTLFGQSIWHHISLYKERNFINIIFMFFNSSYISFNRKLSVEKTTLNQLINIIESPITCKSGICLLLAKYKRPYRSRRSDLASILSQIARPRSNLMTIPAPQWPSFSAPSKKPTTPSFKPVAYTHYSYQLLI